MRLSASSWEFLMSQEQLFQKPATDFSLCLIGPNWITWHFLTSIWQGGRIPFSGAGVESLTGCPQVLLGGQIQTPIGPWVPEGLLPLLPQDLLHAGSV